jgi:cell fate regulator YaaT (PSP1 superfamily)
MKIRPLGVVREIIESSGCSISYYYDDLIFGDNNVFIFQFDDSKSNSLNLFFNKECKKSLASSLEEKLKMAAAQVEFTIQNMGFYQVQQLKGEEKLEIVFE